MCADATPPSHPDRSELTRRLRAEAHALGFDRVGITAVVPSDHAALLRAWLARGLHGSMHYLERDDAVRTRLDPRSAWPALRSAVVVALNYDPGDNAGDERDPGRGIVARYARGRDYHKVIRRKLLTLLHWLESELGRALPAARAYVDTGPVLEREFARRAGLGWFGRNTMLIDPRRGSYFFLGTLLLDVELEHDAPFDEDRCGTCNRCVPACPTGALLGRDANGAPVMDATRCISYLTIENRGPIPRELRPLMGNRVFGCDICQEVCPFSMKFSQPSSEPAFAARGPAQAPVGVESGPASSSAWHPGTESPSLVDLFRTALSEEAWEAFSRGSALRRARREGFARNVAVALGNWGDPSAVPVLTQGLKDLDPLVRAHVAWALGRVGSPEASAALMASLAAEEDAWVREEVLRALESELPNCT